MPIADLHGETQQWHARRVPLIKKIEAHFKKVVIVFQTSFHFDNGSISDDDALMLEEVLVDSKIRKDLLLMVNSPGGFGLAAERIVRVCKKYSVNGFEVLVAHQAKSAGTIICFGSNKIWMGETSEIGPIDPQLRINRRQVSVYNILKSYDDLMRRAGQARGRIEPFLQQLSVYDPRYIQQLRQEMKLSEAMAVQLLQSGMMKGQTTAQIRKRIDPFINPEQTLEHGRPIFREQAEQCRLAIGRINVADAIWPTIWDLHQRYEYVMGMQSAKVVESVTTSFTLHGHHGHPVHQKEDEP
jgi:hypothetical protein